jgi:predicted metal-dependent hydrolase
MKAMPKGEFRLALHYGERRITCEVRRSFKRVRPSVVIHVEPTGKVLVDAPPHAAEADIRVAVTRRLGWISKRLTEVEDRLRVLTPREYVSGETVLYLGRRYRLKVVKSRIASGTKLRGGYMEVMVRDRAPRLVRDELNLWFRNRAKEILLQRLVDVSARLRWVSQIPPVTVRQMKRQWGSCSPRGRVALNVGLVRVPRECIDYVLLHELCHLKVHNHGRAFYRLLDRHLPDWRQVKLRLDGMADLVLRG